LRLSACALGSIANRRDFGKEISEIALTIHRSLARSALLNEHRSAGVVADFTGRCSIIDRLSAFATRQIESSSSPNVNWCLAADPYSTVWVCSALTRLFPIRRKAPTQARATRSKSSSPDKQSSRSKILAWLNAGEPHPH
jgi:hypothetical protein